MKMKNVLNKSLIVGLLGVIFAVNGKNEYSVPDSIKGVKITPYTLMQLAPRVPVGLKRVVNTWLADPKTQTLLDNLTSLTDVTAWHADRVENEALMNALGYRNWSSRRYISEIPGGNYIFKVSGQKDRLISMLATKGVVLTPEQQRGEDFNTYIVRYLQGKDLLPTYNTASGMAYYELLKDRIKKVGYRHIFAPESYLIQLPGKPKTIADSDIIMVQRIISGAEKLSQNPQTAATIAKEVVAELYDVVVALGLWNIKNNVLIQRNGSICLTCSISLVGLAEQKNSSAKDFFHISKERFDEDVYVGLVGLLDLFKDDAEKVAYIQKQICNDQRLKSSSYYEKLMKLAQK